MAGIIILLAALLFPRWYGNHEGINDARKIHRNGSADTLKERWHIGNGMRRGAILTFSATAHWLLLLYTLQFGIAILPAYLLYSVAAFGYRFTTKLNTCRKLPTWYVSRDKRASYTDRFFVKYAAKFKRTPESFSRFLHTVFLVSAILILLAFIVGKLLITK